MSPIAPRMMRTGIIRLTEVNAAFPTKLDTKSPSTTPYTCVNTAITTDGSTKRKSFL